MVLVGGKDGELVVAVDAALQIAQRLVHRVVVVVPHGVDQSLALLAQVLQRLLVVIRPAARAWPAVASSGLSAGGWLVTAAVRRELRGARQNRCDVLQFRLKRGAE